MGKEASKKAERAIKKILDIGDIESRGARYLIEHYITNEISTSSNPVTVLTDFVWNAEFTRDEINQVLRIAKNALKPSKKIE